ISRTCPLHGDVYLFLHGGDRRKRVSCSLHRRHFSGQFRLHQQEEPDAVLRWASVADADRYVSYSRLAFTPSEIIPIIPEGLLISLILMFVARPIAVFASLAFSNQISFRKKVFISWVGLRGAVPIIFAT